MMYQSSCMTNPTPLHNVQWEPHRIPTRSCQRESIEFVMLFYFSGIDHVSRSDIDLAGT